ncbi:hypothetical protein [Halocatena marina]|uniref:hypothetical protein n=1 Tax=Halocatena marina TaxID=2934937 RepID=UPI00200DE3E4|nr:hypothetical protein [Halocatena marina]
MAPEPDENEQFEGRLTLDDVLAAFDSVNEPVVVTSDIAEEIGRSRESARQKLTRLFDQGRIQRRKHGNMIVWWRLPPEEAEERPERRLQRLSKELDEPIVVGEQVFEDGDVHSVPEGEVTPDE